MKGFIVQAFKNSKPAAELTPVYAINDSSY